MTRLDLDDEEEQALRGLMEKAYRDQDREVFEAASGKDPDYPAAAKRRLDVLAKLLDKIGSSVARAMKAITG
jgi:predicted exporter